MTARYPALALPINFVALPQDVMPGDAVWKGASLLGRHETVNELWVRENEFDLLGVRALKDRCFALY